MAVCWMKVAATRYANLKAVLGAANHSVLDEVAGCLLGAVGGCMLGEIEVEGCSVYATIGRW